MTKRISNIYDNALTFNKIREAYKRTARRKKPNDDLITFGLYLEDNILKIYQELKNQTYKIGRYNSFTIKEPKEREISCLRFYDRVVQQLYVHEYIIPYMNKKFISDSYACIPKKGMHNCIKKLQKYMRIAKRNYKEPYILQYDISKFFASIDKKILYQIIKKWYKDEKFLQLTKQFIWIDKEEKGVFIGNYTSQYFANIYLNELDHYIKEKLREKYYIRFMDDGILIVEGKKRAKQLLEEIQNYVENNLKLTLNKKTRYMPLKNGTIYCGYKVFTTHKLVKRQNVYNMKRRIRKWNKKIIKTKEDKRRFYSSFNGWKEYARYANSYTLIKKLEKSV